MQRLLGMNYPASRQAWGVDCEWSGVSAYKEKARGLRLGKHLCGHGQMPSRKEKDSQLVLTCH